MKDKSLPVISLGKVLVVDDSEALLVNYGKILGKAGIETLTTSSPQTALSILENEKIDAVISDVMMPEMDGISLLREIHIRQPDIPVLIVTGHPSVETAMESIECGVFRYMSKPVNWEKLVDCVKKAVCLRQIARLNRDAANYLAEESLSEEERKNLEVKIETAVANMWMAYHPIVDATKRCASAYEALVRTKGDIFPNPGVLFQSAELLKSTDILGRAIRKLVASTIEQSGYKGDIFINLHPRDLLDESLYSNESPLAPFANRIVLEITERAAIETSSNLLSKVDVLRKIGYRIAIDDLGAGYAGLNYFALLKPDVVKIDMTLIRGIDRDPVKRKIVKSLISLSRELGIMVVAEGIETTGERDTLIEMGCNLLQGFLFAKPSPPFVEISWD